MDLKEKEKLYSDYLARKRKARMNIILAITMFITDFLLVALIINTILEGQGGPMIDALFIIVSIAVIIFTIYVAIKREWKIEKVDIDPFLLAEMKGNIKKLKTKGINLNIDRNDTSLESNNSNLERLDKLFELRQKGAISEEEYQELKKETLK